MNKLIVLFVLISLFRIQSSYSQEDINEQKRDSTNNKKEFKEWNRFSLKLGYFLSSDNSGIILGSKQLGLGLVIDLEDALALETSTFVFRGNASYTFGKRDKSHVVIDYFRINRTASKVLDAELEIGDVIYPVDTKIDSKYFISVIRLKYDYSFYQDDRVSLGASLGFFILPINFSFQSTVSSGQSAKLTAPLPVLGLRSNFAITPKLFLMQEAELLYLKVDNFTGSIVDLNFAIEHKTFDHFGFGLGINSNTLRIKAEGNSYPNIDFFGDITMEYSGLKFYASYFF
jgi:hypothetical protein